MKKKINIKKNNMDKNIRIIIPSSEFTDWDCIIIGKGDKTSSAFKVFEIVGNEHISENKVSFWISGSEKYCGMTIFKNTNEGKKLQKMIEDKVGLNKIEQYLTKLTAIKLSPTKLIKWIESMKESAFEEGRNAKVSELKTVLGIENYY
jgi:hypothetical protein